MTRFPRSKLRPRISTTAEEAWVIAGSSRTDAASKSLPSAFWVRKIAIHTHRIAEGALLGAHQLSRLCLLEILKRHRDALIQRDLRADHPIAFSRDTSSCFFRCAIRLAGVPLDLTNKACCCSNLFSQLLDGAIHSGAHIQKKPARHRTHLWGHRLPEHSSAPTRRHRHHPNHPRAKTPSRVSPTPNRSHSEHPPGLPHGSGVSALATHGCSAGGSYPPGPYKLVGIKLMASNPYCLRSDSHNLIPAILAMAYHSLVGSRSPVNRDSSRIG